MQDKDFLKDTYNEEDSVSFTEILYVIAKDIKMIFTTSFVICLLTSFYLLFFVNKTYTSRSTFISSSSDDSDSGIMGLASQYGFANPFGESGPKWSYEEVVKSRTMAKSLLLKSFDTEKFGPGKQLLQIITYGHDDPIYGLDTLMTLGIIAFSDMIEINKTESLYELKVSAFEPKLAADIARYVIEELDKHQRDYNSRKNTETRKFIDQQLIEAKKELEQSEEGLKEFREHNGNIVQSPSLQMQQQRLVRDVAVLTGVFTTLKQHFESAKIDEVKESDYIVILDSPEIPLFPTGTRKRNLVILAGVLGLALGIVLAFVRNYLNTAFINESQKINEIKHVLKNNLLDLIPFNKR